MPMTNLGNSTKRNTTSTLSLCSGKGGVGKTSLVCNFAYDLARRGKKVLVLDGDLGMANVDVFFGMKSRFNIWDVANGEKELSEILIQPFENLYVIPGGSGVHEL